MKVPFLLRQKRLKNGGPTDPCGSVMVAGCRLRQAGGHETFELKDAVIC